MDAIDARMDNALAEIGRLTAELGAARRDFDSRRMGTLTADLRAQNDILAEVTSERYPARQF